MQLEGKQIIKFEDWGEEPSKSPPKPTRPIRKDYGEKPRRRRPIPTPSPKREKNK